jgi:hypothetical protein
MKSFFCIIEKRKKLKLVIFYFSIYNQENEMGGAFTDKKHTWFNIEYKNLRSNTK